MMNTQPPAEGATLRRRHESVVAQATQQRLAETRASAHAHCVVCGRRDGKLPRLHFEATEDGHVEARTYVHPAFEGYAGMLHGGVIATLLDAAMTNCLFARSCVAVTADLHIRYREPVTSGSMCHLRAWIENATPPLYVVRAELLQANRVRAAATAKFMETQTPTISPATPSS